MRCYSAGAAPGPRMNLRLLLIGLPAEELGQVLPTLIRRGHEVRALEALGDAERALWLSPPDVVLVDERRVGGAWRDAARSWRARGLDAQLFFVAAEGAGEAALGLASGAEDFLLPPLRGEELALRLEAGRLRRAEREASSGLAVIDGLELTDLEGRLLRHLVAHLGQDVTREALLREVWGYHSAAQTRAIVNTVSRLRAKLEQLPELPWTIQTVRGVGYRLEPRAAAPPGPALVGRELELEALRRWLASDEAICGLSGPAGVGKTALARAALAGEGPAALVCELHAARAVDDLTHALASALALGPQRLQGTQLEPLGAQLARRGRCVVLLDGVDALLPALEGALELLCRAAPRSRWLITGRQHLPFQAWALRVGPLETPAAVRLYQERARLDPARAPRVLVERLVTALDGLPLAILIAAKRAALLPPAQLLQRLEGGQASGGGAGLGLSQALQSSWDLLDTWERRALSGLSVLPAASPLSAVEAVLDFDALRGAPWALDVLQRLQDASLLMVEDGPDGAWLRLLRSVSEFAAAHLEPGRRARLRARHLRWVLGALEPLTGLNHGPGLMEALERLARLHPHVLSALEVATEPEDRARLLLALGELRLSRGGLDVHVVQLSADGVGASALRARVRCQRAECLLALGRVGEALEDIELGLADAAQAGDEALTGELHVLAAMAAKEQGRLADCEAHVERAEAGFLAADAGWGLGLCAALRAAVARRRGQMDQAEALARRAIALHQRAHATWLEAHARANLGVQLHAEGRLEEAERQMLEAGRVFRAHRSPRITEQNDSNLAAVYLAAGRLAEAEGLLRASPDAALPGRGGQACAVRQLLLGRVHLEQGQMERARELLEHVAVSAEAQGYRRAEAHARLSLAWMELLAERCESGLHQLRRARALFEAAGQPFGLAAVDASEMACGARSIDVEQLRRQLGGARSPLTWLPEALTGQAPGARCHEVRMVARLARRRQGVEGGFP